MTVPVPYTWVGGLYPSATADLNPGVRDPLNFLLGPPRAKGYRATSGGALTGGTATLVNLDGELYDSTGSMHSLTSNIGRIVAPYPGLYFINASVGIAGQTAGQRIIIDVRLNAAGSASGGSSVLTTSAPTAPSSGTSSLGSICGHYMLDAGDYVEMFLTPATTASPNPIPAQTFLEVIWRALQ